MRRGSGPGKQSDYLSSPLLAPHSFKRLALWCCVHDLLTLLVQPGIETHSFDAEGWYAALGHSAFISSSQGAVSSPSDARSCT
jgi:hypothetical protein